MGEKNLVIDYKKNGNLMIEQIITEYSKYIYIVVKNMANTLIEEDVKEIVSDVFVVIWNNKEKLKDELPIKPYIVGVTRNVVRNKYRNIHFECNIEDYENIIENQMEVSSIIEQREKNIIIRSELMKMQEVDRKIFIYYYYYSKNIITIAQGLHLSETNVKTKLHRIRKKLKKALGRGGYFYGE